MKEAGFGAHLQDHTVLVKYNLSIETRTLLKVKAMQYSNNMTDSKLYSVKEYEKKKT